MKQITSIQHPLVKHLVRLREDRAYRYEHNSIFIEGVKLVGEVVRTCPPKAVLVTAETLIPKNIQHSTVVLVSDAVLKKVSGAISPEGIAAEVSMPKPQKLGKMEYVVALDGVSDPGNMGTLLRTALALGWQGAFLLPTCCDPFNDKAIRAGRGAQFRLPICFGTADELKRLSQVNSWQAFVADVNGTLLSKVAPAKGRLLVLGNEAHGPSSAVCGFCERITIPMPGEMESLNVAIAGAILMYALTNK